MNAWQLPAAVMIGGRKYEIHADYRDILEILRLLEEPEEPEYIRWRKALAVFYKEWQEIPKKDLPDAMQQLADFIRCGQPEEKPAPKLLDWQQDALTIAADINKVAGCEIRALPFVHWWTFVAYFSAIGEGQLSMLVTIRDKLRRGKPLEKWERDYYRQNKDQVDLKRRYSSEELAEQERLKKLLGD